MSQFNQQFITLIIDRYGLELDDERIDSIVATWIGQYDRTWIVKAIVESVHRGRYKIKSVDSILSGWQRSGKPSYNFPPEFEREMLQDLPTITDLTEAQAPPTLSQLDDPDPVIQFPRLSSDQLNPEESAPFPRHDRATPPVQPLAIERDQTFSRTAIVAGAYLQDHHSELPSVVSFKGEDHVKQSYSNPHSKFDLFHTLRAIITPNNLPSAKFDDDLDPPSYDLA
jgi:hypothetical protein